MTLVPSLSQHSSLAAIVPTKSTIHFLLLLLEKIPENQQCSKRAVLGITYYYILCVLSTCSEDTVGCGITAPPFSDCGGGKSMKLRYSEEAFQEVTSCPSSNNSNPYLYSFFADSICFFCAYAVVSDLNTTDTLF